MEREAQLQGASDDCDRLNTWADGYGDRAEADAAWVNLAEYVAALAGEACGSKYGYNPSVVATKEQREEVWEAVTEGVRAGGWSKMEAAVGSVIEADSVDEDFETGLARLYDAWRANCDIPKCTSACEAEWVPFTATLVSKQLFIESCGSGCKQVCTEPMASPTFSPGVTTYFGLSRIALERKYRKSSDDPAPLEAPSDGDLKERIVRERVEAYEGNCPCPYSTDAAGRKCGGRSAYSREGGAAPPCYVDDVTDAMVQQHRRR